MSDTPPSPTPLAAIPGVTLRPATPADAGFLFELYATTRQQELDATGWNLAQRTAFLRQQFDTRDKAYAGMFPGALSQIVLQRGERIGWRMTHRTPEEFRLVQLALLPASRGQGLGTALVREFLAEAERAGRPVRLHVLKQDRAARLYLRCGFQKYGENGFYDQMERVFSP